VQIQEYEAIDFLKTKCMKIADRKCRKVRAGKVSFSEATIVPLRHIAWWNVAIRRREGKVVHPAVWKRKKKEAGFETLKVAEMSIDAMRTQRRAAIRTFREAKKKHETHRIDHINKMPKKIRDHLIRVEHQRRLARAAKSVMGKMADKSITKVEYEGREYTSQPEIERILLTVNEAKTRASDQTPFMQGELLQDFGYRHNTSAHEQTLQGTYNIPATCHPATAALITGLARPPAPKKACEFSPRTHITTEDHIRGWKKQREKTSGGMSGLHFGHYKAHLQDRTLAAFDASMRSVAYTTGYALKRWKKGLDVQLRKKPNDFNATNLRTILLLEPDHNMNNKAIGSDAMRMGERLVEHARDNYGGRRGLRAAEVSMNQMLTYNSIWARRGRAIIMSNDAKGCYDRIAHTVVNLALQRLGIPKPALQSMLATIQEMDHHIRTAFGDSVESYGNNPTQPPPQGILQGSGAGQAGWASIVAVMVKKMRDQGFGYKVWTLIRQRAIALVGFAFVDDTDLIHADHNRMKPTRQLIEEAQEALALWEGLLHATGGALAPEKSYWYLVEVTRTAGKWTYTRARQQPGDLFLKTGSIKNTRLEVYQARKSLGIMARPDGKMIDELKMLQQLTSQWCDGIRTKRFNPEEAWYSLTVTILRTLEYPLVATTFTQDQCQELLKPVLKTVLPLCKIQRRLPRALVHGSYRTRGLNLPNLYWVQLIQHIQSILRHMHRDTPSRDMHEENMDLVQFHIGSTVTFWELPFEEYGSLAPDGWMKQTWQALSQTTLTLKGSDLGLPNERITDVSLMDAFVAQGYSEETLRILNECRFWLAASHLSHITTACGQRVDAQCWQGKRHTADMRPRLIHTYRPTTKNWELWQEKIRDTFLFPGVTHLRLRQALGPWIQSTSPTWRWWKHPASQTLYERHDNGTWRRWTRLPRRSDHDKFRNPTQIDKEWLPNNLRRASVHRPKRSTYVTVTSTGEALPQEVTETHPTTLQREIDQLPPTATWALKHLSIPDDGAHIAEAITTHTAIAVSDGGLKMGLGTAAFVIESRNSTGRIQGVNKVPGPIKEGDSHRCEVSGLYAVILLVKAICKRHSINQGSITICCDNTTALQLFDPDYLPDPKHPNIDLVGACWSLKNTVPITWHTEHIKGHQDRHQPVDTLSRKAKLNVAMDKTATAYWIHLVSHSNTMPTPDEGTIYGEGWQLWNGEGKITHPSRKTLYPLMQDQVTDMWWTRERHITHEAHAIIDYNAVEDAMQQLSIPRRRYVTKVASENCGVGSTLLEWKYQQTATCPRCPQECETTQHVQQCQGYAANASFNQSIDKLQEFLTNEVTRPDLQDAIVQCIQKWRVKQPIKLREYQDDVQNVIREQHTIGWLDFMECLPARGWQTLQRQYYREEGLQKSSRRWIRGLLLQLHHMGHKQWRHRCDIKNNITRQDEQAHIDLLHTEIEQQFDLGTDNLPAGDQPLLSHNILHLLEKSLAYKKGWLARIWAARQRAHRIAARDDALIVQSKEASQIYQWCRRHKDQPHRKRQRPTENDTTEDIMLEQGPNQRRRRDHSKMWETEPSDTDPTDTQYIMDSEYCVQILAEPIPAQEHQYSIECNDQHTILGPPDNTDPMDAPISSSTTQSHTPQRDPFQSARIYNPDDGYPPGFTTLRRQPDPEPHGFTTHRPMDTDDLSPPHPDLRPGWAQSNTLAPGFTTLVPAARRRRIYDPPLATSETPQADSSSSSVDNLQE
jgi:hypothetical protein